METHDIIGIDVSMGKSNCAIYHSNQCLFDFTFTHTISGFKTLLSRINLTVNPVVYFESTGIYSRPVRAFCARNQLDYVEVNPLTLHFQMSTLRRLKTDRNDAHKIAQYGIQYPQVLSQPFTPEYRKLRELTRFYAQIETDMKDKRMSLHNALQQTFPELEHLFTSRVSKLALNVIELFPHPELVSCLSQTKLKNILMKSTDKKISKVKALRRAQELLHFASVSYPAASADSVQVDEVRYYVRTLINLTLKKEHLIKRLVELAKTLSEFRIMTSFPGIGDQTAAELIGELGDIRRFSNNRKLNAYIGIDLNRYQSGTYTRQDHINKRGDAHARSILFFTIRNMVRQQAAAPNHIVDYYYRLKKGPHPKRDKVAVVACMNKTVKCLLAMVKANQLYDYSYHGLKVQ